MPKFFADKSYITSKNIKIEGDDAIHICNVLRLKAYDEITICDGFGTDYKCRIISVDKKQVISEILDIYKNENEPNIKITIYQGIPKGSKMEMVIQKCVEIGVDRIVPVNTEYTVVKINEKSENKINRWNKISEAAAKQCGRGKIPIIENVIDFKTAVINSKELDGAIIPYEKEHNNSIKQFIKGFNGKSIGIFIGPEGGFSNSEISFALENKIPSITLGKRILRTETAGLVTSVIFLYELEELT